MPSKRLSNELLEIICCPKCHSSLAYNKAKNVLKCKGKKCAKTFKVKDGVPVMLLKD